MINKGTTQRNYVRVRSGSSCFSWFGMQGGAQHLILQRGSCTNPGTVAHEFMHALGTNSPFSSKL